MLRFVQILVVLALFILVSGGSIIIMYATFGDTQNGILWTAGFFLFYAIIFILIVVGLFGRGPLAHYPVSSKMQVVTSILGMLFIIYVGYKFFGS